jgi:hypothetical protein
VLRLFYYHCRQRAPTANVSSGIDIQVTTKNEYYDHIALLYLETRRCHYQSMIFRCVYLYVAVVIFVDYSDMGKMMDISTDKC